MDIRIEFVIYDPNENTMTPAPNLTLTSKDGNVLPPVIGDIIPIKDASYMVKQRAYIVERDKIVIGKKTLTYSCILVPIEEVSLDAE